MLTETNYFCRIVYQFNADRNVFTSTPQFDSTWCDQFAYSVLLMLTKVNNHCQGILTNKNKKIIQN